MRALFNFLLGHRNPLAFLSVLTSIRPTALKINPISFRTAQSNTRISREPDATQIAAVSSQHESH